jgi:hypothetical protein
MKTTFLKNTFFYVSLLISTAAVFTGCKPEDGNIGPKGAPGENGPVGPTGDKGRNGNLLYKGGFITGTLTGTGKDGVTPINETFRYEYTDESTPLILREVDGQYRFTVARADSSGNGNLELAFNTPLDFSSARFHSADLYFYKKVSEAQYKHLTGELNIHDYPDTAPGKITNFKYDAGTGIATGDYVWTANNTSVLTPTDSYNSRTSTGKTLTVTGSFSIVARKGSY